MDPEVIAARARAAVEQHFERINAGDLAGARALLFEPPGDPRPLDAYLEAMRALAPFELTACAARRFEPFRRQMHGIGATVWVSVVATCALGERAAELTVWWYPADDRLRISSRPNAWVAEQRAIASRD